MPQDPNLLPPEPSTAVRTYGIDVLPANVTDERTGIEQYVFNLVQAMKETPLETNERVVLYTIDPLQDDLSELPDGWEHRRCRWWPRKGWMQLRMGWEIHRRPPSVLFVPGQGFPRTLPGHPPLVTVVHDVGFLARPDLYNAQDRRRLTRVTARSVKLARTIIAVSETTKQAVLAHYKIDPSRIQVVYPGLDHERFYPVEDVTVDQVRAKHAIGSRYFLFIGRLDQKKNLKRLVSAFNQFKATRGIGDPYELVLAGRPGHGYNEINALIEQSSYKSFIRNIGFVDDADVPALLTGATALTLVSSYEGFGLPVVEAMACGAPTLLSRIDVFKEVAGDAALFVDQNDHSSIARGMEQIVSQGQLRDDLTKAGLARAQQFQWNDAAEETWRILRAQ